MFNEKKFKFDIENLKQDLAIEDMYVTEEDISLLRDYQEQKITEQDISPSLKYLHSSIPHSENIISPALHTFHYTLLYPVFSEIFASHPAS